jgi:archaellum component FlaC
MGTYAELTDVEKDQLDEFSTTMRGIAGDTQDMLDKIQALEDAYNSTVQTILAKVDPTETIPNKSGLAGVADIIQAEVEAMMAALKVVVDTYNTDEQREIRTKFAGINV